jgi:hypothetical protein
MDEDMVGLLAELVPYLPEFPKQTPPKVLLIHKAFCEGLWQSYLEAPSDPPDDVGLGVWGITPAVPEKRVAGTIVDGGSDYGCLGDCGETWTWGPTYCMPPRTAIRLLAAFMACDWALEGKNIPAVYGGGKCPATPPNLVPTFFPEDFPYQTDPSGIHPSKCCWWWGSECDDEPWVVPIPGWHSILNECGCSCEDGPSCGDEESKRDSSRS